MARPLAGPAVLLVASLLLASCASPVPRLVAKRAGEQPTPAAFRVCHGYGCRIQTSVALDAGAWDQVARAFSPAAAAAAEERRQIAAAVGTLERLVAVQAGTAGDRARSPILFGAQDDELDCIDEAVNTTTYLRLMDEAGLLRLHRVGQPARRGYFLDRWPHNTATVVEQASGRSFAIDSWFGANGVAASVVPLQTWLAGWSPEDEAAGKRSAAPASASLR